MSEIELELRERNEAVAISFNKGYEQGRKDGRSATIDYVWKRVNEIRFKNCWNGGDFPYSEFVKILEELKGCAKE